MIKEPMFISPRTFKGYEQYKTDCARASGWNEAMAFIFAEELETERSRTIREKFFVVENVQTDEIGDCNSCEYLGDLRCGMCTNGSGYRRRADTPQTDWEKEKSEKSLCNSCGKDCDNRKRNLYTVECNRYEAQTDCGWK